MRRNRRSEFELSRTKVMLSMADHLRMDFVEEDEWGFSELLKDFWLFRKGKHPKIKNMIKTMDVDLDADIRVFDYQFSINKKRNSRVKRTTVFYMKSRDLGIPQLLMRPEGLLDKLGTMMGMQDIDFEEYPEFSDQYLLKGEDEELIRYNMNDKVLKFFTIQKNWYLEGLNYYMILYKYNRLLHAQDIRQFFEMGIELSEMMKWED